MTCSSFASKWTDLELGNGVLGSDFELNEPVSTDREPRTTGFEDFREDLRRAPDLVLIGVDVVEGTLIEEEMEGGRLGMLLDSERARVGLRAAMASFKLPGWYGWGLGLSPKGNVACVALGGGDVTLIVLGDGGLVGNGSLLVTKAAAVGGVGLVF